MFVYLFLIDDKHKVFTIYTNGSWYLNGIPVKKKGEGNNDEKQKKANKQTSVHIDMKTPNYYCAMLSNSGEQIKIKQRFNISLI